MKYAVLIASCVLVAGCATTAKFESILNSFVGENESALITQWGPPSSSYTLGDGSKVLQYQRNGQAFLTGYSNATTTYAGRQAFTTFNGMPAMMIPQQCTVNWTIGSDSLINRWNYSGNACKAR